MTALAPPPVGRPQRLAYFGTPAMAVPPLDALVDAGFDVVLVITGADTRRGRGTEISASAVGIAAQRLGIPVSHTVADVVDADVDLAVVVAFGRLIPVDVLARTPMVNLHFSLLPRWRGAAPVERALLAGDTETGVCVMEVAEGLDTGAVYASRRVPITDDVDAAALRATLVDVGASLLVATLHDGLPTPRPQRGEPTYAAKISASEMQIDWTADVDRIDRLVRLGMAWTTFRGRRLKILAATVADRVPAGREVSIAPGAFIGPLTVSCRDGSLLLQRVQAEGKAPMAADAWARGASPSIGEILGTS